MGGDSPTRLMRFPGDPAMPAMPLVHSLVLSELLVAYDVVETASSIGEATGISLDDRLVGLISGDTTGEALDEPLLSFPLVNLAPCFVTAATTPPGSLPFFRSFLGPGMNGNQGIQASSVPPARGKRKHPSTRETKTVSAGNKRKWSIWTQYKHEIDMRLVSSRLVSFARRVSLYLTR